MAIYRLEAKIIGRSDGRSATASAAYRAAQRIEDERTGACFDYTRKRGVLHSEIIAPEGTPEWMRDRSQLWNAVEKVERRKDSQLARDLVLALPHELTHAQRADLVRDFVRTEFVGRGMIADIAIHAPDRGGDGRNHHAHVMLTMRELAGAGFGKKVREWNATEQLEEWRERWAATVNRRLERHGHQARVDHRSLADQGIDREPEPKQGPIATEIERKGRTSRAGDERRAAHERNAERAEIAAELAKVTAEIINLEHERTKRTGPSGMENLTVEEAALRVIEAAKERQQRQAQRDEEARHAAEELRRDTAVADTRLAADTATRTADQEELETEQQARREAELLRELAEQDKRLQEFKQQREAEAEEARKSENERRKADERRAAEGDVASAGDRYAQALGQNYDMRDPYTSLARAAMAEYTAFKRQQEDLRKEIAAAQDPEKRAALELRRQIEGCEYMAVTSERLAGISATIAGREDAPTAVRDRERAQAYQDQANQLREERGQQQERRSAEKNAERDGGQEQGPEKEKGDRDGEMTDARIARLAAREATGASRGGEDQTRPQGRGGGRGGR